MSAGPFEHFSILIEKVSRMNSRPLSARVHVTVKNMSSALGSVQRLRREAHGGVAGAPVLNEKSAWSVVGGPCA